MGSVGGFKKPMLFTVVASLLIVLSLVTISQQISILGYEMVVKPYPENGMSGWTSPLDEPASGITIDNLTAHVKNGNITSLDFRLGVREGFPSVNISNARIHLMSGSMSKYFHPYPAGTDGGPGVNVSLLLDPTGQLARGVLDEHAVLMITVTGNIGSPQEQIHIYYESTRNEEFIFFPPRYINETLLGPEKPYHITVYDIDRSYPRYPDDAWVIRNRTVLENRTLFLDRDLIVVENGSLEIRNSTILVNSSVDRRRAFRMDLSFEAYLQNQSIGTEIKEEFKHNNISIDYGTLKKVTETIWRIDSGLSTFYIQKTEDGLRVYQLKFNEFLQGYMIYVGYNAELTISNSTLANTDNRTVPISITGSGYSVEVFGKINIERSVIGASKHTFSEIKIYSDGALISNSTINIMLTCSDCSPTISNNMFLYRDYLSIGLFRSRARILENIFIGLMPAEEGVENSHESGIRITYSNPVLSRNRFSHLATAIDSYKSYEYPLIQNNTFTNVALAILLHRTTATIEDNIIDNSTIGILLGIESGANITRNQILAQEPIIVNISSRANISHNSISGYTRYGIYTLTSSVTHLGNDFVPRADRITSSYALYQEWQLTVTAKLERQDHGDYIDSDIELRSAPGPGGKTIVKNSTKTSYWYTIIPVSFMSNDGKRHGLNPYKLTVSHSIWKTSSNLDVGHNDVSGQLLQITLKERPTDLPLRAAIGFIGSAILAYAWFGPLRQYYKKRRAAREPVKSSHPPRNCE